MHIAFHFAKLKIRDLQVANSVFIKRTKFNATKGRIYQSRLEFDLKSEQLKMIILFKNFVCKRSERYFKIRFYLFAKIFFRKTFVQYVTIWLGRIWTYKNATKTDILFHGEEKTLRKPTKNEYCVNPLSQTQILTLTNVNEKCADEYFSFLFYSLLT